GAFLGVGVGRRIDGVAAAGAVDDRADVGVAVPPEDGGGEVGGGLDAGAGRIGEARDTGDGADGGPFIAGGRHVGDDRRADLLIGNCDGLVRRGQGGQGFVLEGDVDGVGSFLGIGVGRRIDGVVAAAAVHDDADVGVAVPPVDG